MDIDNTYSVTEEEATAPEIVSSSLETAAAPPHVVVDDDGMTLDLEKVVVTVALFVVTFIILSPRGSLRHAWRIWRCRRRNNSMNATKEQVRVHSPKSTTDDISKHHQTTLSSPSKSTSTLCTGMVLAPPPPPPAEELTEEAQFAELWPTIRMSNYRKIVLPPECKLVDKPKKKEMLKKEKELEKKKKDHTKNQEDNPAKRLMIYCRHFLSLLKSIYSYDYEGAARTVLSWLHAIIRYRRYKPVEAEDDEEEDDDDASVTATPRMVGSELADKVSPLANPSRLLGRRVDSSPSEGLVEEKKDASVDGGGGGGDHAFVESPHKRSSSMGSVYEVPLSDLGESDVGERVMYNGSGHSPVSPPSIPKLGGQHTNNGAGKARDSLENYRHGLLPTLTERSLSSTMTPASPLSPRLPPPQQDSFDMDGFTSPEKMPLKAEKPNPNRPMAERQTSDDLRFFDAAFSRASLKKMSREVGFPDRNGYIVGDEFLDSRSTPLLVFVNSRSGPQQGHLLITQLRRLLNPIQVWDLADGGPERVLESFSAMSKFRILVCGGDGTVSWIISALEKMAMERWPPIAILPLGTGNDLGLVHGWGGGYNNESLILILEQVADAYISLLDRWEMSIVNNKKKKVKAIKSFTNYLGVGADAQAALQVHMLRENKPKLFFSRAVNKAWYAVFGAEDIIKASCAHLPEEITLIADGVEVPLPPDSQGIILLNIDSYSGGVPLWSHGVKSGLGGNRQYNVNYTTETEWEAVPKRSHSLNSLQSFGRSRTDTLERVDSMDDLNAAMMTEEEKSARVMGCDLPSSCQDGMLDIVSIRGAFHLGQIRVGLSNAQRLCQCREAKITIRKKVAVQIDGEPWRQNTCTLHVKRKKEPAIMLHRSRDESGGVETEMAKLLDWAEERGHINRNVHYTLMKEFSRRIENKTRQRRVKSQDNVMLSLKRAIASTSTPAFPTSGSFSNPI